MRLRQRSKREAPPLLTPEEFLRSITLIPDIDQLLGNFTSKFTEMFAADSVYLVLLEPVTSRYVGRKAKGDGNGLLPRFNFSQKDNLIKWLNINRCSLNVARQDQVVGFLDKVERQLLLDASIQIILPLIVINRLTGALFVGKDYSRRRYSPEEEGLMSSLVSQSALAIEYAMIYQFQEDKLKRLFHADKLVTVGELAAGAAHEIRNPLAAIRSTVQYIRKDLSIDKQTLVDGIIGEVDRIDKIIQGLLSFSRTSEIHVDSIDLHAVLEQTLSLLDSELKNHNIEIIKEYRLSDPCIRGDGEQLKQVFLNIFLNSVQAIERDGKITVTTAVASNRTDFVTILFSDTGPGIPASVLSRVFDPFYTTKENGTGIGLSISYGIVSRHGGEIEIRSTRQGEDRGTNVTINLPRNLTDHQ
ncbi:MAG TPA: ATP-binding protein [Candidatus Acidoferrales bacterium]|nr:ATP-binding protein [Candidatus Acidoferrales bacterium]